MKKINTNFAIITIIIILIILYFPSSYYLSEKYTIAQFRTDLKDFILLLYIPLTLWLALITKNMSEIALNAQKASNRPELECILLINNEKPNEEMLKVRKLDIRSSEAATYIENQEGADVFFVIKNLDGSGKAINIAINLKFEATDPEEITLDRNFKVNFLSPGDSVAFYIYRFDFTGLPNSSLKLNSGKILYTTPFDEAAKECMKEISFDNNTKLLAEGNKVELLKLGSGIEKIRVK